MAHTENMLKDLKKEYLVVLALNLQKEREKFMEKFCECLDNLFNTDDNLLSKLDQADRNSCWRMFFKLGVLEYFAIFTGKHLRYSFVLINLQTSRPATLF